MPAFRSRTLLDSGRMRLSWVACDGVDAPRPREEPRDSERVIVALSGGFAVRSSGGQVYCDPSSALVVPGGASMTVSHPRGHGDVCLAVAGPVAATLAGDVGHVSPRPLSAAGYVRLRSRVGDLDDDGLGIEEALVLALAPQAAGRRTHPSRRRDRAVAEIIAGTIACRFDERLSLADLAAQAGVSTFHACRAFRRITASSIHAHRLELRLRHALAAVLDGRPLAEVAQDTGFASQAHLTTRFRRRFGVTPGAARRRFPDLPL